MNLSLLQPLDQQLFFYDQSKKTQTLKQEVAYHLKVDTKTIAPKFFYDKRGALLFTQINRLPENYLAHSESVLIRDHISAISNLAGDIKTLVGFGSSNEEKMRVLIDHTHPTHIMPVHFSRDHLFPASVSITKQYPWLNVHAICSDFLSEWHLPEWIKQTKSLVYIPSSTIELFDPDAAFKLLKKMRKELDYHGSLLIGIDIRKPKSVMDRSTIDEHGIRAEFNLNCLHHLNHKLKTNFDVKKFKHIEAYNEQKNKLETFIESTQAQVITIGKEDIALDEGEKILTSASYKYTTQEFMMMIEHAGYQTTEHWVDDNKKVALYFLNAF